MARETFDELVDLDDLQTKRRVMSTLGRLGGLYEVTAEPRRNTRSVQACRYYFGVIVKAFCDFMREQGQEVSKLEAHEYFKQRFGLKKELANPLTGEPIGEIVRETKKYDTAEFHDFTTRVAVWLGETFGIVLPEPETVGPWSEVQQERA